MPRRRTLLFAVLVLWGSLLTLRLVIHPVTQSSLNYGFFTALGMGIDYFQFWVVGQARERMQLDNIYSRQARQQMVDLARELLTSGSKPSKRVAYSVDVRRRGIETFSTPFLYAVVNSFDPANTTVITIALWTSAWQSSCPQR
jgi:hypothetical protein